VVITSGEHAAFLHCYRPPIVSEILTCVACPAVLIRPSQIRIRLKNPDLRVPDKGLSHGVALAAELMLLRKELAAYPSKTVTVTDTCGDSFIDDDVKLYYNRTFKDMEAELSKQPGQQGAAAAAAAPAAGEVDGDNPEE
jgi:hypothetical protein